MAPDDRKIKCTTRLGALDVPRSSAHKAKEFVGFRTLFSHLFVRGKIAWHPHTKVFLCIARFQRRFVDIVGGLYRWFFAGDILVFTLGLIKYERRWFEPTDKIVKIWLQGITVCDRIDSLENLDVLTVFGRSSTNNRSNIGPSRDPWGTPDVSGNSREVAPRTVTCCLRSCKYERNQSWSLPVMPYSFIYMRIKNHFHINGLVINLALKQRLGTSCKRPIGSNIWKMYTG